MSITAFSSISTNSELVSLATSVNLTLREFDLYIYNDIFESDCYVFDVAEFALISGDSE